MGHRNCHVSSAKSCVVFSHRFLCPDIMEDVAIEGIYGHINVFNVENLRLFCQGKKDLVRNSNFLV